MHYNRDQFNKDLKLIAMVFGQRKQRGYFAEQFFEDANFKICDSYIMEPQIHHGSTWVQKNAIKMNSIVAHYVINKAIQAEEILFQQNKVNPYK
jgi:hypothetical protein